MVKFGFNLFILQRKSKFFPKNSPTYFSHAPLLYPLSVTLGPRLGPTSYSYSPYPPAYPLLCWAPWADFRFLFLFSDRHRPNGPPFLFLLLRNCWPASLIYRPAGTSWAPGLFPPT